MKKIWKATLIDFSAPFLFIITSSFSIFRLFSVLFPLAIYFYTWDRYKKEFWKAYAISVLVFIVVIFGSILILLQTEYKYVVAAYVIKYMLNLLR